MKEKNIVVDLAKITKRQMIEWRRGRRAIANDEDSDPMDLETFDFESLYQVVVMAWPYGKVDLETFLDLPFPDSVMVDNVVANAMEQLSKKK